MDQNSTVDKQQNKKGASRPEPGHSAHFYASEDELLPSLTTYVRTGLKLGETCVVIANLSTLISLNKNLRNSGINLAEAIENGSYITRDAEQVLANIIVNEMPDKALFEHIMGNMIVSAGSRKAPIRVFGEMAGVLMKKGNLQAVVYLEKYCQRLMKDYPFSLYCAYLDSYFDQKPYHQKLLEDVCSCHVETRL